MYEISNMIPPFFWGKNTSSKMGRDPLAVQNSSVVIYSNMVKGITNMTVRVRYNGFFCWLLTFIAERLLAINKDLTDIPDEQIKYIRRGEILLAYEMAYNHSQIGGVSGSIFVQRHMTDSIIDIAKGADIENKPDVYWQNGKGIFGQYYVGVLTQLRLVFQPDTGHKIYRVTPAGYQLGSIYGNSISQENKDLFWNAIYNGSIEKERLKELNSYSLHLIENESELMEYKKIFCMPDGLDFTGRQLFHRRETIKLLLKYIDGDGKNTKANRLVLSFLKYNFLVSLESKLNVSEEEMSWFLYELNELSHAAYEAFHFALLDETEEEPQPLDQVILKLSNEYEHSVDDGELKDDIYVLYDKIQDSYVNRDNGSLVYAAAELLLVLYKTTKCLFQQINHYAESEGYDKQNGYAPYLLTELVGDENRKNDWDFVEKCLVNAINDHLKSSYSKSAVGQGIVHNYMVEDGLIWRMRNTFPIRTSPRLQSVLQYIEDIKWVEKQEDCYLVTERGSKIMM